MFYHQRIKLIIIVFSGVLLMYTSGCDIRGREKELERRTGELNHKEQQLLLKEKSLQVKEEELARKETQRDSTLIREADDSLSRLHPGLPGLWTVTMRCIETTCPGFAVGDTKTEQWEIIYSHNTVIAKAMSGNDLVRVYAGTYSGNALELTNQLAGVDALQNAKMVVRLKETGEGEMEGQREIIRAEDCRIVYALELKKKI